METTTTKNSSLYSEPHQLRPGALRITQNNQSIRLNHKIVRKIFWQNSKNKLRREKKGKRTNLQNYEGSIKMSSLELRLIQASLMK